MHATIVVAHPNRASLTHAIADKISEGIMTSDGTHSVERADLTAEGFDPRFTEQDIGAFVGKHPPSADVLSEQSRIDRSDALVLVYPVYWWTMPAILKGWIDRVFTNGWAYDDTSEAGVVKLLPRLSVHLVAIGGADQRTYARHGYFEAMKTQIDHGIFGYCGAPVATSEFLLPSDPGFPGSLLDRAHTIGGTIFQAARHPDLPSL